MRRWIVFLLATAVLAAGCSSDDDDSAAGDDGSPAGTEATEPPSAEPSPSPTPEPEPTPTPEPTVTVGLVDYPDFATTVLAPDPPLLDELAADYRAGASPADRDMKRFLFGHVPVAVFHRIFAGQAGDDLAGLLWLMHLSGYYGGRWLRGEIATAQPDAPLVGFSSPPTEEAFGETMARAQVALDAAAAGDAEALAYARASLYDEPPAEEGGDPVRGLTDTFGYNQGYMLEILATPPEGLEAGEEFQIDCEGLFGCTYASPRLAVLGELAAVQDTVAAGAEPYTALAAELLPIQEAAVPAGRSVWSSGLSVQGFPQDSYDQLLDVSSSFLETVQATGLTMTQAAEEGHADQARAGAQANAAMVVWLAAYTSGLIDGETDIELPSFSTAAGT